MIRTRAKLGGIVIDSGHWWDLGNRESYLAVHRDLSVSQTSPWIDPTVQLASGAQVSGATRHRGPGRGSAQALCSTIARLGGCGRRAGRSVESLHRHGWSNGRGLRTSTSISRKDFAGPPLPPSDTSRMSEKIRSPPFTVATDRRRAVSGRKFWRMRVGAQSLILVHYGEDRPENRHYVAIARFPRGCRSTRAGQPIFMRRRMGSSSWRTPVTTGLVEPPQRTRGPSCRALYQRTLDQALHPAHAGPPGARRQVVEIPAARLRRGRFISGSRIISLSTAWAGTSVSRRHGLKRNAIEGPLHGIAAHSGETAACSRAPRFPEPEHHRAATGRSALIDFQGLRARTGPIRSRVVAARPLRDAHCRGTRGIARALFKRSARPRPPRSARIPRTYLRSSARLQRLMQALGAYGKTGAMPTREPISWITSPQRSVHCGRSWTASRDWKSCAPCSPLSRETLINAPGRAGPDFPAEFFRRFAKNRRRSGRAEAPV